MNNKTKPDFGFIVDGWVTPMAPSGQELVGQYARLVALDANAHAAQLFPRYQSDDGVWDYLPYGPFETVEAYTDWMRKTLGAKGHLFYAIENLETGRFEGVASYLRIDPSNGSIEVGNINYSPALQQTRAGTEAMFLMMSWAFEAGYRRYEWKCNALNVPSRRAAERLGFSFEGVFRQATVVKGRNRDTAWFGAIDAEWPALKAAFELWLSSDNFTNDKQHQRLSDLTAPIRFAGDPTLK